MSGVDQVPTYTIKLHGLIEFQSKSADLSVLSRGRQIDHSILGPSVIPYWYLKPRPHLLNKILSGKQIIVSNPIGL